MRTKTILLIATILAVVAPPTLAQTTPVGRWNLLVVRADFSDAPGTRFTPNEFRAQWVPTLVDYFYEVSNQNIDVRTTILDDVIHLGERRLYHRCDDWMRPPPFPSVCQNFGTSSLAQAAERGLIAEIPEGLAPVGGTADDVFDGILVVFGAPPDFPFTEHYGTCGSSFRSWFTGPIAVRRFGSPVVVPQSDDYPGSYQIAVTSEDGDGDCSTAVNPVADVGPAVHELGHMIANSTNSNAGHPSAYDNSFELMDRCYPCFTGAFTRFGPAVKGPGFSNYYPGWLPDWSAAVFDPPIGGTEVLSPIESDPDAVTTMALRAGTADGSIYMAECRRRLSWDDLAPIPDEGVLIVKAVSGASPEVTVMAPPGRSGASLWRPGEAFADSDNDLTLAVGPDIGSGCTMTASYGPLSTAGIPDVGLTPWQTPPNYTWETVDIWVDSSCNGYEDAGHPLRYGRDMDGNVRLNGDDFCANGDNRVYARVRNYGSFKAENVTVRFFVTNPPGVGIRDAAGWTLIGAASPVEFPTLLNEIPPGGEAVVWAPWRPSVTPPSGFAGRRFPYHTCLQVKVDAVSGERLLTNQDGNGEQENLAFAEARRELGGVRYGLVERELLLSNGLNQTGTYMLFMDSDDLPSGWDLSLGSDEFRYDLDPASSLTVPMQLHVPDGVPLGLEKVIKVRGVRKMAKTDPSTGEVLHWMNMPAGGAEIVVRTVEDTGIDVTHAVDPANSCVPKTIFANGCLDPGVPGAVVSVSFTSPSGVEATKLATTDGSGCFVVPMSASNQGGTWTVEAFWHGDATRGSVSSGAIPVVAANLDDLDCDTIPNAQDNCEGVVNPNQENTDQDARGDACDCAPTDAGTWEAPAVVAGLRISRSQLGDDYLDVSWYSVEQQTGPGVVYDLVSGNVAFLSTPLAFLDSACLLVDATGTGATAYQPTPQPGQVFWYLLRGQNPCGRGSYDSGTPSQKGSRDGAIEQGSAPCA